MNISSVHKLIGSVKEGEIIRIFAVDNNPTILMSIRKYFDGKNKNVFLDTFTDPTVALDAFKKELKTKQKYTLAIIDWDMPKITGELLSVMLKDIDPDIKTVLYTGSNDDIFLKHFHHYKFDAVLNEKSGIHALEEVSKLLSIPRMEKVI